MVCKYFIAQEEVKVFTLFVSIYITLSCVLLNQWLLYSIICGLHCKSLSLCVCVRACVYVKMSMW